MENLWFYIAFVPPFFWGLNNMIDQYLGRKYFSESATGLQAFQGFLTGLVGIGLVWFTDHTIPIEYVLIIIATGILMPISLIPYTKALQIDHAGIAIPLFQLQPVFIFIGGYLILGEAATLQQLIASLIIITASFFIVADIQLKKMNWKTLWLMTACCSGLTFYMIIMRYMSQHADWFSITVYSALGSLTISLLIFASKRHLVGLTISQIQKEPKAVIILSIAQELLSRTAMFTFQFGLPLATTAALYQTVIGGVQPFYILLLGYPCYYLARDVFEKPALDRNFYWRFLCITVMCVGLYYLYQEI